MTMTLRDRIRRWWNPAQWRDDHPLEAQGNRSKLGRWFGSGSPLRNYDNIDLSGGRAISDRDFKKPR
jgi:hypothetical protein